MRGLKGRWEGGGCVAVGGEERERRFTCLGT